MTRTEKIREARRLRDAGETMPSIGAKLGVSKDLIWKWLNPEKVRAANLLRNDAKRAHERAQAAPCAQCGTPLSDKRSDKCAICENEDRRRAGRDRTERYLALRREGLTNRRIAEREEVSEVVVATIFHRAGRYGLEVGRSPYYEAAA